MGYKLFSKNSSGQSLLELVIVIAVSLLVVGAITFATITSLRNAQAAQNQNQATRLAEEGIERIRSARDRNANIIDLIDGVTIPWDNDSFWLERIPVSCAPDPTCYFNLQFNVSLNSYDLKRLVSNDGQIPAAAEGLNNNKFKRVAILSDDAANYQTEKQVTVIVSWNDFAGDHQSKLSTYLRRI